MADQTNNDNREIDFRLITGRVRSYASKANNSFFNSILFLKRNIIIIIILIVLGALYGNMIDNESHIYEHKVYVIPNFGSTDYLYGEVEHINTKLKQGDADFLQKTGLNKSGKFVGIEIDPVVDIYSFIENPVKDEEDNDRRVTLFKLISESGDMTKTLEDEITSRNYKMHLLTVRSTEPVLRQDLIDPLFNYLNSNPYFKEMQKEYIHNLDLKIAANDVVLKQIDGILNGFSGLSGKANLVYYNDNTEMNEVIRIKNRLTNEQAYNRIEKVNYDKIIKDSSMTLNMRDYKLTTGMMKYIFPIVFILAFAFIVAFIKYYKREIAKRKAVIITE